MVPPISFSAHGGSAKFKWIDTVTAFLNTETTFSFSEECSASRANTHTQNDTKQHSLELVCFRFSFYENRAYKSGGETVDEGKVSFEAHRLAHTHPAV